MGRLRPQLSYANVVSTICLFVVLGGGAYAATQLPKNSVGTKQLKKNAVKGSNVANGSLTAADISGPVGSARKADEATSAATAGHAATAGNAATAAHATTSAQAANADLLGGAGPSSYLASVKVKRADFDVTQAPTGSQEGPLVAMGPVTLRAKCVSNPSSIALVINGSTTASNGSVGWGYTTSAPSAFAESTTLGASPSSFATFSDSALGQSGAGEIVYRDPGSTVAVTFRYFVSDLLDTCRFFGVALQA